MLLIILLCLIGFFVILLIALLVLPFSILAKVERLEANVGYQIAIRYPWKFWGFALGKDAGQWKMRILIGNKSIYEKLKRKKKPKGDKPTLIESESISEKGKSGGKKFKQGKPKRKFGDFVQIWELIRKNAKPIMQFLKDILRCLKKACIGGDLEIGVSDPALMGMLYGIYWAILWNKQQDLKIKPNFVDTTFFGWIEFETYIILLPILYAFIKLAFKVPIIKLIRVVRQRKATTFCRTIC